MSRRLIGPFALASAFLLMSLACGEDKGTNPNPGKELDSPALLGATTGSQNYIHVFANTGSYPYHCTFHTTSHYREGGTAVVSNGAADSVFVSISQGAFNPATATVRPNGQVRWQNFDDGVHHTVTSD